MKEWFLRLEPRERLLVAGGALVLVLLLLYLLIVEPRREPLRGAPGRRGGTA